MAPEPGDGPATGDPPAVRTEGLTKRLRNGIVAVDHLDLVVERGRVLGLVGPNGSGKTITFRLLLGLVRPTAGRAFLFGEEARPGAAVLARVGALVDGPGFVPHLSGRRNLGLAARQIERSGRQVDFEQAVAVADLGTALDRPVAGYSHGMGYRLALAQALLGGPELLLLDEPTTGMDPARVGEVHAAVADAVAAGTTVLISTHRLAEVERICTDVAVVHAGRLLATGPVAEVVGPARVLLLVDDSRAATAAVRGRPGVAEVEAVGPGTVAVAGDDLAPVELCTAVAAAGVTVSGFRTASFADRYADLVASGTTGRVPEDARP